MARYGKSKEIKKLSEKNNQVVYMAKGHLYRGKGTEEREKLEFEKRYGHKKGDYVYGATVSKVKKEQTAKRMAAMRAKRKR